MRQYWRGATVLLLFVALGAALWIGLYRILAEGRGAARQGSSAAESSGWPGDSDTTLDTLAKTVVPVADPYDLAERLRGWQPPSPLAVSTPTPQKVGAGARFRVLDLTSSRLYEIRANLIYAGNLASFWVEDGIEVPGAALLQSAQTFEGSIYPTVVDEFGPIPEQDHVFPSAITILNLRLQGAQGYFSSADLYPSSVIPSSNERAMFYMAAGGGEVGSEAYNSTLAHELQHMIHWRTDPNEESWVSEGFSELAELLCGYSKANRLSTYFAHSDIALEKWSADAATTSQHYSAAFLFSAYYAQRFGPQAVRRLVLNKLNGISGYDSVLQALGTGMTFEDLFADWVVANYVDDLGSDAPYAYEGFDVSVKPQTNVAEYAGKINGTVSPFGADYIALVSDVGEIVLRFSAEAEAQVVPTRARSGTYFWWSNRGDNSDMTLTRTFDLTNLSQAHLLFSLWYDIEDGWDYAYVEVSPDGGRTWRVLTGAHTTMRNPTGQSYGPGYTGQSTAAGLSAPEWLDETVDLSDYAGQVIAVRFEYLTDDAINQSGLCIDDIRVPELGYSDDVEHGDQEWVGRGFVRIDNVIPRRYLLQTFAVDAGEVKLERYWIERGRDTVVTVVTPAIVSISDVTRFADGPAAYELTFAGHD